MGIDVDSSANNCEGAPVEDKIARAEAPRTAPDINAVELTMPIKRPWFEMIAAGQKRAEFRSDTPFWRKRLLDRPALKRLRLINGRAQDAPYLVSAVEKV